MDAARRLPRLRFARLRMTDPAVARALFADLLGWAPAQAPDRLAFHGPGLSVEVSTPADPPGTTGAPDLLGWQVPDLLDWQRHCHRQGLSVTDGGLLGPGSALQLAAGETGGCTLEFSERMEGRCAPQALTSAGRPGPGPRPLAAIELRVRAPERVAAHWGRLLGLPIMRQDGLPAVATPCGTLCFLPAQEQADAGIDGLRMRPAEAGLLSRWSHQRALGRLPAGHWMAGGLRLRCD